MRISSAFPSKYLKASDIPEGREIALQIDDVRMENMEQSRDEKPVLYFIDKTKGLVLNVTNGNTLADVYGDDTDAWHGKPVVLFSSTTSFQGKNVPCLRVRIPRSAPAPLRQETPIVDMTPATDDIPF